MTKPPASHRLALLARHQSGDQAPDKLRALWGKTANLSLRQACLDAIQWLADNPTAHLPELPPDEEPFIPHGVWTEPVAPSILPSKADGPWSQRHTPLWRKLLPLLG